MAGCIEDVIMAELLEVDVTARAEGMPKPWISLKPNSILLL
jgi:hypothetical protein